MLRMISTLPVPLIATINHVLDQADWARARLQPFSGKQIRITMPPFSRSLTIDAEGRIANGGSAERNADLDIELPADTPLRAMRGNESVMQSAQIRGPADLADALGFVLRNLRWDIEEDLSKIFGDIAARRIVAALNAFVDWQRQAARNLGQNVGEYLVEEKQSLVKRQEFSRLAEETGALQAKIDSIERRVKHLPRGSAA